MDFNALHCKILIDVICGKSCFFLLRESIPNVIEAFESSTERIASKDKQFIGTES